MQFKVLVVDDDADIVDAVAETLSTDHDVLTALNGEEAIEIANRERPDVILLDVSMPKMDGYRVARALRCHEDTRDIPIIMLTGHNEEKAATKGFRDGVSDYLVKPFTPSHLRARVDTWLIRRHWPQT